LGQHWRQAWRGNNCAQSKQLLRTRASIGARQMTSFFDNPVRGWTRRRFFIICAIQRLERK